MTRRIGLSALGLAAALSLSSPDLVSAHPSLFPDTIALPPGFQPEGVVLGAATTIYVGSIPTGAIYQADIRTGRGSILVPPQTGRAAIGLEFDRRTNLIYVAGGATGDAYVYSARTGATVATFELTAETSTFVNDLVVTRDAVYFTDSSRAVIYRVGLSRGGRPSPDAEVTEIPLGGDWEQVPNAFNANGIEATGGDLILVNSTLGALYRVDPDTGEADLIDLGDADVTNGDGIVLRGDRLFVVQNRLNQIAEIDLDRRATRGEVEAIITDDGFDVPTTVDNFGGVFLYAVNARFGTAPTPETTYTIVRVPIPRGR